MRGGRQGHGHPQQCPEKWPASPHQRSESRRVQAGEHSFPEDSSGRGQLCLPQLSSSKRKPAFLQPSLPGHARPGFSTLLPSWHYLDSHLPPERHWGLDLSHLPVAKTTVSAFMTSPHPVLCLARRRLMITVSTGTHFMMRKHTAFG